MHVKHVDQDRLFYLFCLFVSGATAPQWARASSFTRFLDHTQWRTTVGRTPLDEWSARRRDLYLTTHDTCNRQTSMPPVGFEPTISAGERAQTYALDRAATGTGSLLTVAGIIISRLCSCAAVVLGPRFPCFLPSTTEMRYLNVPSPLLTIVF